MAIGLWKFGLAGVLAATSVAGDSCDTPDTDNAKCSCNGVEYDFSVLQPTDGNNYFSGADSANEYMFYFQMTNGGLPNQDGAMPYCQFADGKGDGNSAGQGQITGNDCYPIGLVSAQTWEIDTSVQPQVITITFTGGEDGRQSVLAVTCDESADGDPNFTIKGEIKQLVYEFDMTHKAACSGSPSPPSPPSPPNPPPNPPPSPPSPPNPGPPSPNPGPSPPHTTTKPNHGGSSQKKPPSQTGNIIVILFFVFVIVYLVGGYMYMWKVKQVDEPGERIPQKEMWLNLGGLIKDGCVYSFKFAKAKITRQPMYESL